MRVINKKLKISIKFLFIIGISTEIIRTLIMAIYSLYYIDNGLSLADVSYIKNYQIIAWLLLEIPAGYLADKYGRLKLFKISLIFYSLAFILLSNADSFESFALSEFIYGCAFAFNSGTLFGDFNKKIQKYKLLNTGVIFSKYMIYKNIFTLLSGNLGNFIYKNIGKEFLFLISGIGFIFLLVIMIFYIKKYHIEDTRNTEIKHVTPKIIIKLMAEKNLWKYFLISMIFAGSSQAIYQYWSILFKELGFNINIVFSLMMGASILGGYLIKEFYRQKVKATSKITIFIFIVPLLAFNFVHNSRILLILFIISQLGRGMMFILISKIGNDSVTDFNHKSTIFSISGTLSQILSLIFLTSNGLLSRTISIKSIWGINAFIFCIICFFINFLSSKKEL